MALKEEGWRICSVVSFDNISNTIKAHQLDSISTRAKDDTGRRYWVYSAEKDVETYEEKNILQVRPSITLAKNIKRKDPVFALLNREVIEACVFLMRLPYCALTCFEIDCDLLLYVFLPSLLQKEALVSPLFQKTNAP